MEDKKYSILIVAFDCHYTHVERFVKFLKHTNQLAEITLFTDRYVISDVIKDNVDDIIYKHHFTVKVFSKFKRLCKFLDKLVFYKQIKSVSSHLYYDIINVHYPLYYYRFYIKLFHKMSTSLVLTPWGSDVLRLRGKWKKHNLAKVFRQADYITAGPLGDIGKTLVKEMRVDEKKMHPLAWGSETIDFINEHVSEVSKEKAKENLGLSGKYLITCGYNAFEEQRHEIMINAIQRKRGELPSNMTLLFPVTYGWSYGNIKNEYVERLKKLCDDLQLPVVFYEDYLSVSELFMLRRATDLFIHIQTTDAGNSSLQEYVLCGAKVVHGSWIHYDNLEQYKPLFYYPVNSLNDLDDVIVNACYSAPIQIPNQVLDHIRNRGWNAKMKLWDEFFCSISK